MKNGLKLKKINFFQVQGKRKVQEDLLTVDDARGVGVLLDGFGGANCGDWAAKLVSEAVMRFFKKEAGDPDATLPFILRPYFSMAGNLAFNALIFSNKALYKENLRRSVYARGGAAALSWILDGNLLALAQVGSTQAYLFREGVWTKLTEPRSLKSFYKNVGEKSDLTIPISALGVSEDFEPEIIELQLRSEDLLFFSTDGIDFEKSCEHWMQAVQSNSKMEELERCVDNATGVMYRVGSSK